MAKCSRCGKGGIFFKVNDQGICPDCEKQATEENRLKNLKYETELLQKILSDQQSLYQDIHKKATEKALADLSQSKTQIEVELNTYTQQLQSCKTELAEITSQLEKTNKDVISNAKKLLRIKSLYKSIEHATKVFFQPPYDAEIVPNVDQDIEELLSPTVELKLNCMNVKKLKQEFSDNKKVIVDLVNKYSDRYTTKANKVIYQLIVIAMEAELQNILFSIRFDKLETAIDNVRKMTWKFSRIATEGNQNIANTINKFIGEIEYLYIEAVKIEYEYFVQQERIKEEQRALREQIRQEAAERKLLEQQRKQIEKEEQKYINEIEQVNEQLKASADPAMITVLETRLIELKEQLENVEMKKEDIISLQNGKAGSVYVISNLGAFGEKMFKVGMTRRLNPQDRINELGDASVPFPFDIHCMIFSDEAVGLENNLHKELNDRRVNKVNLRKEFFYTTIDELEEMVYKFQPSATFNRTLLAEQYHQSMSISEVPFEYNAENEVDEEEIDEEDEKK